MGQELIAELNSFEVDCTSAGNMRADVGSKDHHGGLVIATSLALWSAGGRPSAKIEVGHLENYRHDLRPERTGSEATSATPGSYHDIRDPHISRDTPVLLSLLAPPDAARHRRAHQRLSTEVERSSSAHR
jgi:hypothetical protein